MECTPTRRRMLGMAGAIVATLSVAPAYASRRQPEIVELAVAGGRISRVTHWRAARRRGTILFSHGALSSPAKYDPLILPWVAAGYDVWAPLHVDSTDHPDTRSYTGFMSWRARIEDMRALSAHITGPRIAAGHSYGALVALTLGGAAADIPAGLSGPLADRQVKAVIAFSPPGPTKGLISRDGYATLVVPALIETGTRDVPPTRPGAAAPDPDSWHTHLAAYDAAAAAGSDRYALVLEGVNHFFGGLICWLDQPGPPQLAQMAIAGEISRLFLDAYGLGSAAARQQLDARLSDSLPAMLSHK